MAKTQTNSTLVGYAVFFAGLAIILTFVVSWSKPKKPAESTAAVELKAEGGAKVKVEYLGGEATTAETVIDASAAAPIEAAPAADVPAAEVPAAEAAADASNEWN